jgi:serine/threonine-protein kinase HipA
MTADLQELRGVERAWVYKKESLAGILARRADSIEFAYLPDYLVLDGSAVATTLPKGTEPVSAPAGAVPAFFAGLLPEGRRLSALRAAVKTSRDDELSLLLAVGGDTIGDVRIVPEGVRPGEIEPRVRIAEWSDVSFAELFATEAGGSTGVDRVGIPGVQDKASAAMMSMPVADASARYILKLDPPEYPHLVANEAFMLRAAGLSGLPGVDFEVVADRDGRDGLLVRRFDRGPNGELFGVEDGCQVLGRYPAAKYGLSTEDVCAALAAATDAPVVAGRDLLRWVGFAYLSCDGDLHAKNLAVGEQADGTWRVTPAFDLPSSYPYGDYTMALTINGKLRENIARRDLVEFAGALRVPERAAGKVIDDLLAKLDTWLPDLAGLPYDPGVLTKWRRAIGYRARHLSG